MAAASLGWPDQDFPLLFSTGAQLLGALPEAHIYRRANVVPSVSLDELLTDANEYVQHIRARPSPKPEQAELVWNKTMEEVELGYTAGPFPAEVVDKLWGEGKWRPIVRFGTEQRDGSFRVIDNGRSGLQNDATGTQERIHTCSSSASVAILRKFKSLVEGPLSGGSAFIQGIQAMKKAFRQVPIHDDSLRFCIIAVWDPRSTLWVFFLNVCHAFRFDVGGSPI